LLYTTQADYVNTVRDTG